MLKQKRIKGLSGQSVFGPSSPVPARTRGIEGFLRGLSTSQHQSHPSFWLEKPWSLQRLDSDHYTTCKKKKKKSLKEGNLMLPDVGARNQRRSYQSSKHLNCWAMSPSFFFEKESVEQAGLKLAFVLCNQGPQTLDPPASTSQVLELQACVNMPGSIAALLKFFT